MELQSLRQAAARGNLEAQCMAKEPLCSVDAARSGNTRSSSSVLAVGHWLHGPASRGRLRGSHCDPRVVCWLPVVCCPSRDVDSVDKDPACHAAVRSTSYEEWKVHLAGAAHWARLGFRTSDFTTGHHEYPAVGFPANPLSCRARPGPLSVGFADQPVWLPWRRLALQFRPRSTNGTSGYAQLCSVTTVRTQADWERLNQCPALPD
jgi:hypothetical protein